MSTHSMATSLYKRLKNAPLVGALVRGVVARLKIVLASWHYSNNRLRADLLGEAVSASIHPPSGSSRSFGDPHVELARRIATLERTATEGRQFRDGPVTIRMVDADGLTTMLDWTADVDLTRVTPLGGMARIEVEGADGMIPTATVFDVLLPRLCAVLRYDGAIEWRGLDVLSGVLRAGNDDDARSSFARAVAGMRYVPLEGPSALESWLRAVGMAVTRTMEGATYTLVARRIPSS